MALPPLKALQAFEAVARLGSVSDAAAELFVTPGAISQQIKKLENCLGIRLVERKLWNVLSSEGVAPMESVGQPFDPARHDAVMVDEGAERADTVVEEFQRGYLVHDSVLRPAMVKVGSNPNGAGSGPQA